MDTYLPILNEILSKCSDHFLKDDFDVEIKKRFHEYFSSSYNYLVELYPVYFMHISFYDKYIEYGYGSVNIFYFNYYFMPYQSHLNLEYYILLKYLYNKVKGFNLVDDLSDLMSNITMTNY